MKDYIPSDAVYVKTLLEVQYASPTTISDKDKVVQVLVGLYKWGNNNILEFISKTWDRNPIHEDNSYTVWLSDRCMMSDWNIKTLVTQPWFSDGLLEQLVDVAPPELFNEFAEFVDVCCTSITDNRETPTVIYPINNPSKEKVEILQRKLTEFQNKTLEEMYAIDNDPRHDGLFDTIAMMSEVVEQAHNNRIDTEGDT